MRFYYFSMFSWMAYIVVVLTAIGLLSILWVGLLKFKLANPVYWILVAAIVIGPWTEELWIAYNFDRLCRKDAGVFVNKTVEVAGFYDDTTGWGPRQLAASNYQFMESRDILKNKLLRVERADEASRDRALAWYAENNQGKEQSGELFVVHPINDKEQVVVSPNGVNAWHVATIDKPTAQYHYKARWSGQAVPVAHKIWREDSSVVDAHTGEVLGEYVAYSRGPYWFFISLGAPTIVCEETSVGTRKYGSLIHLAVLKPLKQ